MSETINEEKDINPKMFRNYNIRTFVPIILAVLLLIVLLHFLYNYNPNTSVSYTTAAPLSFGSRPPNVSDLFNNLCE
tara:strand:+ start:740 stop:970 length:231 start_codon:yes stop_codon:yes gene_type:complete